MIAVDRDQRDGLVVTVESAPEVMGCPACGVIAHRHGRVEVRLVDAPAFGRPVTIVWLKRRWRCPDSDCSTGSFVEQNTDIAAPRAKLTRRACWWAIGQLRREHATVNGLRRQLGTGWDTVWDGIKPLLQQAADEPSRFDDVTTLGGSSNLTGHLAVLG